MTKRGGLASSFALATLIAGARDAHAEPVHKLQAELDAPIILVGGAITAGFLFLEEAPNETCARGCDRSRVVWFDRWAAGRYSTAWSTVGDIATGATTLFGPLVLTIDEGLRDGAQDSLVVGEAILMSSALQVLSSYAVPRVRHRGVGLHRNRARAQRRTFSERRPRGRCGRSGLRHLDAVAPLEHDTCGTDGDGQRRRCDVERQLVTCRW
jgi:hypothetical protein